LLDAAEEEVDLHFITDDKDYCSDLDEDVFCVFLSDEWREKKRSKLVFYTRISAFFKEHFPDITLATELDKDLLIQELINSRNFARTHTVVAKLSKYAEFTPTQLNAIVGAAILNNQVKLIIDDPDVHQFLSAVIKGNEKLIEGDNLETLRSLLTPPKKEHIQNEDVAF
jgi:hypothetical protein